LSKYRGACWTKSRHKYQAEISHAGRCCPGVFEDDEEAARECNRAT
jgi:hypothetical protein